jgi:Ca2+-binding RTX toxin-like protein
VDAYARAAGEMMKSYAAHGRRVYWLTLPAPADKTRYTIYAAVDYALRQAALRHDRVRLLDMVKLFTPGYEYRRRMRVDGKRVTVREPDGVHLNRTGARVALRHVRRALRGDRVIAAADPPETTRVTLEYEAPIPHVEPSPAYTLAVEAAPGERNHLRVVRDSDGFLVQAGAGEVLSAGARCSKAAPGDIRCPVTGAASHLSVFVDAANQDDSVVFGPMPGVDLAEAVGGSGDDVITGSSGADLLIGGPGSDALAALDGADRLDGGTGSDKLDGGTGVDLVTYGSRGAAVTVDLAAGRGGAKGESDSLAGFEDVTGGRGSDRLRGNAGPNVLYGGTDGDDIARGRGGNDTLSARRSFGGTGNDIVDGKFADCGGGLDLVARLRFQPPGPYGRACEHVRSFFYNVSRPRLEGRKVHFAFTCPVRRCSGKFVLRDRRGRLGSRRYASLGKNFGGKPSISVTVPLGRRPAGRRPDFVVRGQALARDSFRLRLR